MVAESSMYIFVSFKSAAASFKAFHSLLFLIWPVLKAEPVNLDFADIKSVMRNAWSALMWIWYGSWENRAIELY